MRSILEEAIAARAFPGAVIHLSRDGEIVSHQAVGWLGYGAPYAVPVTFGTKYDLASLTKIYTLAAALLAFREAEVPLQTPLRHFFPAFNEHITLELLMAHGTGIGFPIQALGEISAGEWITRIAAAPLVSKPGNQVLYSCTNFFLLARATEEVVGDSVDSFLMERILRPLALKSTSFQPGTENVAPTERNESGFWCGTVHDEAARSWRLQTGTCAGNAGLFATAADVAHFATIWTKNGPEILQREDVARALSPLLLENSYWRALGFQIDAAFYMSPSAPHGSAGHLGFTGPSLVTHFETGGVAVILNNRVHPTRNGPDRLPWHRRIASRFFDASHS